MKMSFETFLTSANELWSAEAHFKGLSASGIVWKRAMSSVLAWRRTFAQFFHEFDLFLQELVTGNICARWAASSLATGSDSLCEWRDCFSFVPPTHDELCSHSSESCITVLEYMAFISVLFCIYYTYFDNQKSLGNYSCEEIKKNSCHMTPVKDRRIKYNSYLD